MLKHLSYINHITRRNHCTLRFLQTYRTTGINSPVLLSQVCSKDLTLNTKWYSTSQRYSSQSAERVIRNNDMMHTNELIADQRDAKKVKPPPPVCHKPTTKQLRRFFIVSMIPMTGFGFMDNMIMLQAGEFIDTSIGVVFALSTLTAAACGQVLSDVCGVMFGGFVSSLAHQFGVRQPEFNLQQQRLPIVQWAGLMGRLVGVVLGCLLGMTSLFFMDLEESQRLRRFKELQPILVTIVSQTKRSLGAGSCRIYMLGYRKGSSEEVLFEVGGHTAANATGLRGTFSGSLESFSHHFNRKLVNGREDPKNFMGLLDWCRRRLMGSEEEKILSKAAEPPMKISKLITSTLASSDNWVVAEAKSPDTLELNRPAYNVTSSPSKPTHMLRHSQGDNKEAVVSYVARTGHAVFCVHRNILPELECQLRNLSENNSISADTITVQMDHSNDAEKMLLCYPVFDDMDRDRVIGVIELADKRGIDGKLIPFAREDERLVKMLSEHLSLYLALGSHYHHHDDARMNSVDKIAWLCPGQDNA